MNRITVMAPVPMTLRVWMLMAFPARLPIRRRDLDECAALEGFSGSNVSGVLDHLKNVGLVECVERGLWRRRQE